jgi:hypothetical protein
MGHVAWIAAQREHVSGEAPVLAGEAVTGIRWHLRPWNLCG